MQTFRKKPVTIQAIQWDGSIESGETIDAIGAKIKADHPHLTYTAEDLVRRAVRSAGRDRPSMLRWGRVKELFGVGAGVAISICEACGADPLERVGIEDEPGADGEE